MRNTFLALALLTALNAQAGDWKFRPNLVVSERFTDNVGLEATGKDSEFITEVNPGFRLTGESARALVSVDYSMRNIFYAQGNRDDRTNHFLDARARTELVDDFFFLDAKAAITQQFLSLLGPISVDTSNDTNNVGTFKSLSVSPYLVEKFGSFAFGEARYTGSYLSSDSSQLSNSSGHQAKLTLKSGPQFDDFQWNGNYLYDKIDYEDFQDTEFQQISFGASYPILPRLRLLGSIGYEKNDFFTTGREPEGEFWNVGFNWRPSRNTSLEARVGRRFFGNTYLLDFQRRTRRFTWNVSYTEDLTSSRSQFLFPENTDVAALLDLLLEPQIPDDAQRALEIQNQITQGDLPRITNDALNLVTNQTFLQKRFQATLGVNLPRSLLLFTLYNFKREIEGGVVLGVTDFSSSSSINQTGVNSYYTWRFAPRTSANFDLTFGRNSFPEAERVDRFSTFQAGLTRRLSLRATGSLDYRYTQRTSSDADRDFKENSITARLIVRF